MMVFKQCAPESADDFETEKRMLRVMETKTCRMCKETKPTGEFYVRANGALFDECKACRRALSKAYNEGGNRASVTGKQEVRARLVEFDGLVFLVADTADHEVLVEATRAGWDCSACGLTVEWRTAPAAMACIHVRAVCLQMPMATALQVMALVAPPRISNKQAPTWVVEPEEPTSAPPKPTKGEVPGAEARAAKAAEHDAVYVAASDVVTRRATAEDLAKLEARRAAKARTLGDDTPDPLPATRRSRAV